MPRVLQDLDALVFHSRNLEKWELGLIEIV